MKWSPPTGRRGQAAALGFTILVLAAFWLGILAPLLDWHADRATALAQRVELARRMAALAAAVPALQQQAAAVVGSGIGEPSLLDGDSDAMASASLQEFLQSMFLRAGVQLNSVETLPGEEAGAYRRIRLRVAFNVGWPGLMALLKDMSLATPVLLIDELQVQPALHRISTAPGTFDITCSVFAFRPGRMLAAAQ